MAEILEPGTQIKIDMRETVDDHHREHHGDWVTISEVISGSWGHRYACACRHEYTVYADPENILKTRQGR